MRLLTFLINGITSNEEVHTAFCTGNKVQNYLMYPVTCVNVPITKL